MKLYLNGDDWKCKAYLGEDWIWRNGEKRETQDVRWWKPGRVPGSVTDDMFRCGEIPDPYFEKNSLAAEWIPERTWIYRKEFVPEESLFMENGQVHLCFKGVDYDAYFYCNDVYLGEHHSMYTPVEFDVTGLVRAGEKNLVSVVLHKAPDEQPQVSKTRYVKTHKSRMTYWWDFCPRMIHMGIWDDVYLDITGPVRIGQPDLETVLEKDFKTARITASVPVSAACHMKAVLMRDGRILQEQTCECAETEVIFSFVMEQPALWWPNGYGAQPLYTLCLTAETKGGVSDERQLRFGIRDLKFVKNETRDQEARPYTVCVNGRKIYMKGYNWVPVDVMYGVKREKKLERLLGLAKEASVNCLRIWGGGLIEREEFYDLCDASGIMLWQEFIQSSSGIENEPSHDPAFLELMEREAGSIIPIKKHHPSLALWGGGNELSGPKDDMITMEEPVIAILGKQVERLDPGRYFLESSPTGRRFLNTLENIEQDPEGLHDVHGPWEYQGLTGQYRLYNAGTSLLASEFGVEGLTNYDTLAKSMNSAHMWPPGRDNEYYFHRGSWWNNDPLLQKCFGQKLKEIRQSVRASQFLQYEGLKYAVEANRRRAFTCSGTFPWQFNEPYPNNTCTCSVDYYAAPKPAYYGVKKAYARETVTARFTSMTLRDMEELTAEIYWQSSEASVCAAPQGSLRTAGSPVPAFARARLYTQTGEICSEKILPFSDDTGEPLCAIQKQKAEKAAFIGRFSCPVSQIGSEICYLLLTVCREDGEIIADNRYLFTKSDLAPLLSLPKTFVRASLIKSMDGFMLDLCNAGNTAAAGLWLEDVHAVEGEKTGYLYFSDNYLYLMPDETGKIKVRYTGTGSPEIRISAFNVEEIFTETEEKHAV